MPIIHRAQALDDKHMMLCVLAVLGHQSKFNGHRYKFRPGILRTIGWSYKAYYFPFSIRTKQCARLISSRITRSGNSLYYTERYPILTFSWPQTHTYNVIAFLVPIYEPASGVAASKDVPTGMTMRGCTLWKSQVLNFEFSTPSPFPNVQVPSSLTHKESLHRNLLYGSPSHPLGFRLATPRLLSF